LSTGGSSPASSGACPHTKVIIPGAVAAHANTAASHFAAVSILAYLGDFNGADEETQSPNLLFTT
jgi:SNF family Na+-dependent transporter